jgi:3-oxoadipate enol-lactonase
MTMNIEIDSHFQVEYSQSGQGSPVVFLHAFPLCDKMWESQLAALEGEYLAIAPNARGFANTTPFVMASAEVSPSIPQLAHDLNAFLDALQITEPIVLCGLSMGGYTALNFAHEYPERLRALVLCDARAEADSEEARAKRNDNIQFAQEKGTWAITERLLPALVSEQTRNNNPALMEQLLEWGSSQHVSTITEALEALRDRPDTTPWLPEISVPTLIILGEHDGLVPPEAITNLKNGIPHARLEIIPEAGHLSNLEQPAAFNRILLDFLRSLD